MPSERLPVKDKHVSPRYAVSADKQSKWFNTMSDEERAEWERKRDEGLKRWRAGKLHKAKTNDRA